MSAYPKQSDKSLATKALEGIFADALAMIGLVVSGVPDELVMANEVADWVHNDNPALLSEQETIPVADAAAHNDAPTILSDFLMNPWMQRSLIYLVVVYFNI